MHILVVGLNYRTAPVAVREKFAIPVEDMQSMNQQLKKVNGILECVIVATCNRTELYLVVERPQMCQHYLRAFLEQHFQVSREEFNGHLYFLEEEAAATHLFRVASGLDSMVIGETQILGQVRDAFLLAQKEQTTGTIFNRLFKQAVTLAKRAHSETSIGENPVSVSYAAVELGKRIFGGFSGRRVLIIGAGKMSELTAKHLYSGGAESVTVVNRTWERALELAEKFGGRAWSYYRLNEALAEADIVISSTGSHEFVLLRQQVEAILPFRKKRPLFMIDIAVPRDLDPMIAELPGVYLYDIDDLESIVEKNLEERRKEAVMIEAMIREEYALYESWYKTLGVGPVIQALQEKSALIHKETMDSLLKKLPHLSERDLATIRRLSKSIVNQLLRDPILRVKEMAGERDGSEAVDMFVKIFALEDVLLEGEIEKALNPLLNEIQKDPPNKPFHQHQEQPATADISRRMGVIAGA
ncbi:MAG: glutamyl-tRNA reductase [Gorillibacterium sp.]|nr:glutamyl-tRNA reductase [Gorillibacterium sp.]